MKTIINPKKARWAKLSERPVLDQSALQTRVRDICEQVKLKGDKALLQFSEQFDGVRLNSLQASTTEIATQAQKISPELRAAIKTASENIKNYHGAQKVVPKKITTTPGVRCWSKTIAIERVGLYIPGGSAPLFSTLLMLAIPATLAGCDTVVVCTPPNKQGLVPPAIAYCCELLGINQIFKTGGAQAIAAMTFGTESIPKVYKIFGPGNQYVTMAKTLMQQEGIAIDMPAGPSEVLVIADQKAKPQFVAADLLSQAEHGVDSQVILCSNSTEMIRNIKQEIAVQLSNLPRKTIAQKAMDNSLAICFDSIAECIAFSNIYAPEHLIIATKDASGQADKITNAGSVFLGNYTPESAGDYASGTNHTLPTNGYAKMYSGVTLGSFCKQISFQKISKSGLERLGSTIMTMAAAESLEAHKNAVAIRLKN